MKKELLYMSMLAAAAGVSPQSAQAKKNVDNNKKPNVLFIMVDDLRPKLGCYGDENIMSPNIDALAGQGTVFNKAYCNYPVCGPSRASLLSGLRPNATRYTSNQSSVESDAPNIVPIQNCFKNNGYYTIAMGKVYHHKKDYVEGWSEMPWYPTDSEKKKDHPDGWRDYQKEENLALSRVNKGKGNSFEIGDVADEDYFDGRIATRAINKLKILKEKDQPFFMTVGFIKPHLPFNAPQKYFDMYPLEDISLPDNYYAPEDVPEEAMHNYFELRAYLDIPNKKKAIADIKAKELIRGYRACVTYVDAMVGRVLNSLEEQGLAENTVVVLIGDHGWHLGEHSLWAKHTNFDLNLNSTLIVKAPGMKGGQKTEALVEFIDLFPSFCELAGIPAPSHLEGDSFVPVLSSPKKKWKEAAYSKMGDGWSVRTQRYLYTEWINKQGEITNNMLYDHKKDPNENVNIANDPKMAKVVNEMKELLNIYLQAEKK